MAFTYTKVNFLNNESYNEIKHSEALASGWPNYVVEGFEYDEETKQITNGRAMNGGLPVILGRIGETQTIPTDGTNGYIVLVTKLAGVAGSVNTIEMRPTKETIINASKNEFPLYSIDAATGKFIEDFRTSNIISELKLNASSDKLSFSVNGKESNVVPVDLTGAEQRVLKLSEAGINDDDFTGMIFDQAIEFIANKLSYPVIFNDSLGSVYWPNLTKTFADKHQGETEVGFFYKLPSAGIPAELEIRPNGKDYCYKYRTDNNITPVTKYGDFCMENMGNNHFTARNTGKYINKLKETNEIIKIGFFGDSLTRGFDNVNGSSVTYIDDNGDSLTSPAVRAYGDVLINDYMNNIYPDRFVYENMGWSGGTVEDLYKRYWKPRELDACFMMIGTNDDSYNLTPENYEYYYAAAIERQLYYGVMPIIVGSITKRAKDRDTLNTYRMIAKKLAKKYALYYVDGGEVSANMDNTLYSDGTHLNEDGYSYLGRCLSVPLIEDGISGKQIVGSGSTILFNDSDNVFKSNGIVTYSNQYPTPTVSEAGEGSAITLAPGQKIYVPFKALEDALYIFPQIYFTTDTQELTIRLANANKVPQMKNAYYEVGSNWNIPIARYGRWVVTINGLQANYRVHTVYNMIGSLENKEATNKIVVSGQKGEQLLILENTNDTENITIHLIEFLSEKDYLLATQKAGSRYFKNGTSHSSTLSIENEN